MPNAEISKLAEMIIPRVNTIEIIPHDRMNIDKHEQQDCKLQTKWKTTRITHVARLADITQ